MAAPRFDKAGKRTIAVFLKRTSNGRTQYVREQYNIVQYNTDNEAEPKTYLEGLRNPILAQKDATASDPNLFQEVYDEIMITDVPPFPKSRIGDNLGW